MKCGLKILFDIFVFMFLISFLQTGFRLNNGVFVMGPMAIFSKSVLCWNVRTVIDITPESLSAFYLLEPKLGEFL